MTVTIGELAAAGMPSELAVIVLDAIEENSITPTNLTLSGVLTIPNAGASVNGAILGASSVDSDFGDTTPLHVQTNATVSNHAHFGAVGANAVGAAIICFKTRSTSGDANTIVQNGDQIGQVAFYAADGSTYRNGAYISARISGTPGTTDVPTDLEFATTADGSGSGVIRYRLTQAGKWVQDPTNGSAIEMSRAVDTTTGIALGYTPPLASDVGQSYPLSIVGAAGTSARQAMVGNGANANAVQLFFYKTRSASGSDADTIVSNGDAIGSLDFWAADGSSYRQGARIVAAVASTPGASDMPTSLAFLCTPDGSATPSGLMTLNASGIPSLSLFGTVTSGGTTGNQTINRICGTVNFAAAATSVTVTCSACTANSIVLAQVSTLDATMTSVRVVPGAGSFVITANAGATAETSVRWLLINAI